MSFHYLPHLLHLIAQSCGQKLRKLDFYIVHVFHIQLNNTIILWIELGGVFIRRKSHRFSSVDFPGGYYW